MLTTEQILNAKFTPVSKGTYSAEEVDAFLNTVAASYENSLNSNQELIKKISILADKIESYRSDEEAIKLSLLDAHRMAETVNKNAKDKADAVVADAESKSKIILDGANRQSNILVEEAREKAKEIVDNARTAVASLTDRAQKETDLAINSAREKSAEIISKAEEEGKKIIGSSKEAYEFYSSELERIKAETENYKKVISEICNNQLSLINTIPEITVNSENEAEIIEEIIEENQFDSMIIRKLTPDEIETGEVDNFGIEFDDDTLNRIVEVIVYIFVWIAIYNQTGDAGGLTLEQMVTYYILVTALRPLILWGINEDMAHSIRNGQINKELFNSLNIDAIEVGLEEDLPEGYIEIDIHQSNKKIGIKKEDYEKAIELEEKTIYSLPSGYILEGNKGVKTVYYKTEYLVTEEQYLAQEFSHLTDKVGEYFSHTTNIVKTKPMKELYDLLGIEYTEGKKLTK